MSDDLKPGIVNAVVAVVEPVIMHPKSQMLIATGTTATAIDMATIQYLQPILAIVAATMGLILTSVLIVRNVLLMTDELAERRRKAKDRNAPTV